MKDMKYIKSKKVLLIVVLAILLVVGIAFGYSFAYFTASVVNDSSINNTVVTTAALEIEFSDGPKVSLENAIPGGEKEKTFKVKNNSNTDIPYDIYMSEVINTFEDKSDLVYTLESVDGGKNITTETEAPATSSKIVDSHILRADEEHNYTLKIKFKETNDNQDDNKEKKFDVTIRINEVFDPPENAIEKIRNLVPSDDLITDETSDSNIRYIGSNPNNFVRFNDELWRIIGIMNNMENSSGQTKSLIKIIKYEDIGSYSWDTSDSDVNSGSGVNQWGESTYDNGTPYEGSDLMRELNYDYLGDIQVGTDGYWYNGQNNQKSNAKPSTTISSTAQNMIENVVWKLGTNTSSNTSTWTPVNMYDYERSTNNAKRCTSGSFCTDTVVRTTSWTGKIGLVYASDLGYATKGGSTTDRNTCLNTSMFDWATSGGADCRNNNWLKYYNYWIMTPSAGSSADYVFFFDNNALYGSNNVYYRAYKNYSVYPTLYLKSTVNITGGNGSRENPYTLSL